MVHTKLAAVTAGSNLGRHQGPYSDVLGFFLLATFVLDTRTTTKLKLLCY